MLLPVSVARMSPADHPVSQPSLHFLPLSSPSMGELCFFLWIPLRLAALGPGVHSASNRNEYQKKKNNNVPGEYRAAGA
jgi:hypothetical protein